MTCWRLPDRDTIFNKGAGIILAPFVFFWRPKLLCDVPHRLRNPNDTERRSTMHFLTVRPQQSRRLGILPGTFNPPTIAHLALAEAALAHVDEVVLVLPRVFPHKNFEGASFDQRAEMLRLSVAGHPRICAAVSAAGMFFEIAEELRAACGAGLDLSFVCGSDAAQRIVTWDYGDSRKIDELMQSFQLLVACRSGVYDPPPHLRPRIHPLVVPGHIDLISASEVRRRIRQAEPWQHLVPQSIAPMAAAIYRPLV